MIAESYNSAGRPLTIVRTQKFKTEFLSVSAAFPISREEAPLTSLLLSVLRRGTEKYPTLQAINRRLDSLYGAELSIRNFYRGDYQIIGFSLDLLGKKHLPEGRVPLKEALEIVTEILYHPLLDANGLLLAPYVEDEKRYQQDLIRSAKNNPSSYAMDRCQALFYGSRPCAAPIYGTVDALQSVTPERLTAHWKKILSGFFPECFFIGSLEKDELDEALVATLWSGATKLPSCLPRSFYPVAKKEKEQSVFESFPACQSHLAIGLTTGTLLGDTDYYAMKVYNEILLGSSPVSKLFLELREKQSLCYSCASTYQSYTGAIFIRCGLSGIYRERAEEEIRRQLKELANGKFTDFELESTKKSFLTAFCSIEDSPEALENYFFGRSLMGQKISIEESCKGVAAVSRKSLLFAAQKVSFDTEFFLAATGEEGKTNDENDEA